MKEIDCDCCFISKDLALGSAAASVAEVRFGRGYFCGNRGSLASMLKYGLFSRPLSFVALLGCAAVSLSAQTSQPANPEATPPAVKEPTHGDLLRGAYGPYRANNDLLFYHLHLRVDPGKKFISGPNTIRFKMLQDGTSIQLELY